MTKTFIVFLSKFAIQGGLVEIKLNVFFIDSKKLRFDLLFMAFLLGFFLKNLQNLLLVGIVLKNSNLIVRTKSVYTFMIKIGCHEVPSIVLTHAKSVNR